jgi:hypothetical protein
MTTGSFFFIGGPFLVVLGFGLLKHLPQGRTRGEHRFTSTTFGKHEWWFIRDDLALLMKQLVEKPASSWPHEHRRRSPPGYVIKMMFQGT